MKMNKYNYSKPVIVIRKKIEGENSIEEIANRISRYIGVDVLCLPYSSRTVMNLIRNIVFVASINAPLVHLISSDAYLLPFIKKSGIRLITYHDLGTSLKGRNAFFSFVRYMRDIFPSYLFADCITFVSKQTQNEFFSFFPKFEKGRARVIYNSYDERLVSGNNAVHEEYTVLQMGASDRKNIMGTIEACRGIHNLKLVIIGKVRNNAVEKLEKLKINYVNKFDVKYEEIVDEYRKCDVVCFPSFYEGFGVPIIEANVMGKPVISSNIPVIREVGDEAVYYVDPNSIEEIRNALLRIRDDSELKKQLVKKGYKNAERFSPENIMKEYKELYEELIQNGV